MASSIDISGVVWNALTVPPAETAIEKAAAETFVGSSMIATMSYSPNASQPATTVPSSCSSAGLIASIRFCGLASRPFQPSVLYATSIM